MYLDQECQEKPYCRITAPGKAILCGEHAVVYGEDAIALAIGLYCTAQIGNLYKQQDEARVYIYLNDGKQLIQLNWGILKDIAKDKEPIPTYEQFKTALKQFEIGKHAQQSSYFASLHYKWLLFLTSSNLQWRNWQQKSLKDYVITITSNIPIGKCLGSSAAFNSVLASACLVIFQIITPSQQHLTEQIRTQVNALSLKFEAVEHGNPSGIDNFVSVHGGAILFNRNKNPPFKQLPKIASKIKSHVVVAVADSGVEKNTKAAVGKVKELIDSDPKYKEDIKQIGGIASKMIELLQGEDQNWEDKFFKLVARNHELLRQLGVSHPEIEKIVTDNSLKGWSCKVTGSGMGGCVLLLSAQSKQLPTSDLTIASLDQLGLQLQFYKISL